MQIARVLKVELSLDPAAGIVGDFAVATGGGDGSALGLDQPGLQPCILGNRAAINPLVGGADRLSSSVAVTAA